MLPIILILLLKLWWENQIISLFHIRKCCDVIRIFVTNELITRDNSTKKTGHNNHISERWKNTYATLISLRYNRIMCVALIRNKLVKSQIHMIPSAFWIPFHPPSSAHLPCRHPVCSDATMVASAVFLSERWPREQRRFVTCFDCQEGPRTSNMPFGQWSAA